MTKQNRSMPPGGVIPVLPYPDVAQAVMWLCRVFGFRERLRIGTHRVQLLVTDDASVVVTEGGAVEAGSTAQASVMIAVADVRAHAEQSAREGAEIVQPPTDHPYGERQYSVRDLAGRRWTFTQSIADSDPAAWGGELLVP